MKSDYEIVLGSYSRLSKRRRKTLRRIKAKSIVASSLKEKSGWKTSVTSCYETLRYNKYLFRLALDYLNINYIDLDGRTVIIDEPIQRLHSMFKDQDFSNPFPNI